MGVSAVIVSWEDAEQTARAVRSLERQSVHLDEIVVVDNHPDHPAAASESVTAGARVICSPVNSGFAGGAACGVAHTSGNWIFVMNPDATAASDCVERLLEAADPTSGLVGAQILLPDGRVNAGDNPVHLSGITWAGHLGEPAETTPARSVASVSGAAMLIRRDAYAQVGGIAANYFLYHEDVDLCWRMRLAGWDVVFQPAARVVHDYAFDKGSHKWFLLERNRARTVLTCYSGRSLLLLFPLLLGTELAIAVAAARGDWWREKRTALVAVWRERRALRARRASVQRTRSVGDREIVALMASTIETPYLPVRVPRPVARVLAAYQRLVLRLLP